MQLKDPPKRIVKIILRKKLNSSVKIILRKELNSLEREKLRIFKLLHQKICTRKDKSPVMESLVHHRTLVLFLKYK